MSTKWTITQLIALAGLAAVYLVLALFGGVLQVSTGIIGANIIWIPLADMIVIFGRLLVNKFGAATILYSIYGIGALPLATLGPPGFLPKIFIGFTGGLTIDIIFLLLHRRPKAAAMTGAAIYEIIVAFEVVWFGILLGVPGLEIAKKFLLTPFWGFITTAVIALLGVLGAYLGILLYKKLENTAVVKRIQA